MFNIFGFFECTFNRQGTSIHFFFSMPLFDSSSSIKEQLVEVTHHAVVWECLVTGLISRKEMMSGMVMDNPGLMFWSLFLFFLAICLVLSVPFFLWWAFSGFLPFPLFLSIFFPFCGVGC